jgi:hypothetical protein
LQYRRTCRDKYLLNVRRAARDRIEKFIDRAPIFDYWMVIAIEFPVEAEILGMG